MASAVAAGSSRLRRPAPLLVAGIAVAVGYVVLGVISRNTVFPGAGVSLVWLPAGFGVGVLTRVSRQLLLIAVPALMIAEFSADFWVFGFSLEGSLVFTAANILEQGLLATVFRTARLRRLTRARQLVPLASITGGVVLVTAMFGALASVVTFNSDYGQAWLTWYLGSVTSVVLMTPFVLSVHMPGRKAQSFWIEAALLVGGTLALSALVFTQPVLRGPFAPFAALLVPLLAWVGVRLGFAAVTAVAPVVVLIGAVAAAQSRGPFMDSVPDLQLLLALQAFLVLACLTVYGIALLESDRRHARTEERIARERLDFQARHDQLTGLLNRFGLAERLTSRSEDAEQAGVAVLFGDLDGFKELNDVAGHHVGDAVLRRVAERIVDLVPENGDIARLGGDEFVVVQPLAGSRPAESIAAELHERLKRPIEVDGREFDIGVSIGIAELAHGDIVPGSVDDLIRRADVALQEAKEVRGVTRVYRAGMDARRHAERETRAQLAVALDNNDVLAWFQPMIDLATGRVVGAEALARVRMPQGGVLEPDVFISVAEKSSLIVPLGRAMITQALAFAATWMRDDPRWSVSVNVSTRELLHDSYANFVLSQIEHFGLQPTNLRVEVTEQVIMDVAGTVPRVLNRLRDAGVGIVLDDFGTGFSSLTALRELPARTVKIDRQFTQRMLLDAADRAIARGVIQVSRDLGRTVVAEGVESPEQWQLLSQWGCHVGQGNLFGPALPASQFDGKVRRLTQTG